MKWANTEHALEMVLLLLLGSTAALGQSYKPAIEYQSLLNMRYYENNGGFLVEDLQLVFPPANVGNAKFVVTDSSGSIVDTVPLRYERMEFPAFGRFRPASGNPGNVRVGRSGSFIMSVVVDGQPISSLPFSLREENSSDPFNPGKRFVRDGAFGDFAYFSVVPDDPNGEVTFNWWMSLREVPGAAKTARVTIHLLVNGKELAASMGPVIASLADWQFIQHRQLSVPSTPRNHWLTLADLTKTNGEVALVLKADGQPIKTYKAQVSGGQLQRLPRNALSFEPHAQFISPRFIDVSARSSSRYKMYDMYWVRKQ
ncbi:MAG: hypothetical protein ABR607_02935 [Pyrinomonadaceae bacterium]